MPDCSCMATIAAKSNRLRTVPTARLEARITPDFKKTLEQAAAVTGHSTLTSFVIFALQASAQKVIEDHRQAKLTAEESDGFVQALLSPPAPNAALRTAFKRYRGEVNARA